MNNVIKNFILCFVVIGFACNDKRKGIDNIKSDLDKSSAEYEEVVKIPQLDTLIIAKEEVFKLEYNNEDSKKFGVEFFDYDLPVGQPSLALCDNFIFIVDAYHNNIKRFSLKDRSVISSIPLSNERIWVNDIISFNDQVLVTSDLDTIYSFDQSLNLIQRRFLKDGPSTFIRKYDDDSLILHYRNSREYVSINGSLELLNSKAVTPTEIGQNLFYKNKMIRELKDNVYETQFGILETEIHPYYGTVDFDSLQMVSLSQDSLNLVLTLQIFE